MNHDAEVVPFDPAVEPGSTAQHQAYCHIRRRILSGIIGPGERINLAEIADALLVSRMPVRDALRHLDAEGLVVMRPNRGASVIDLTPAEVEEYFQIRAALEGLGVSLAVPQLSDDDVEQLALANEQMDRATAEPAQWLERHRKFHFALYRKCGRPRLIREIGRISDLLTPIAAAQYITYGLHSCGGHDHVEIVRAMRARDVAAAEEEVRQHILAVGSDMVLRMESLEERRM